jgi:hypothetical protein
MHFKPPFQGHFYAGSITDKPMGYDKFYWGVKECYKTPFKGTFI